MSEQQPAGHSTDSQDAPEPDRSDDSQDADSSDDAQAEPGEITDDQLPEDLQPAEDNPLARHPGLTGDKDDQIGADTESGDAANPSASATYGSDDEGADTENESGDGDDSS